MVGVAYVGAFSFGSAFKSIADSSVAQGLEGQAENVGMSGLQTMANGGSLQDAEGNMLGSAQNDEQNDIGQAQGVAQSAVNNPNQFASAF